MLLLPLAKKKSSSGQSYLDLLISVAILLILSATLFTLVASAYDLVSFTKARITARHLAQEKIELIRNLPYVDVGTVGGIPAGPLLQTENIVQNGLNYIVKTSIIYIDDPFDQLAPNDLLPVDYKRVRVDVSWEGLAASAKNPITLITDVAPRGVETMIGGGTLSILVFDASGQPVPQANASIVANGVNPPVNLNLQTSNDGRIILPGAPTCISCYHLTITKENYTSDRTYSTEEIANPDKPLQTILESQLTEISFTIDKVSTLDIRTVQDRSHNFATLVNQTFRLRGEKTLGRDVYDEPVYKYNNTLTTNTNGQLTINDLEWDNYYIILPDGTGWDMAGTNPLIPIVILPDEQRQLAIALSSHTNNSLLAIFKDPSLNPISSVSATLSDGFGFVATKSGGLNNDPDFGQTFFANLESRVYMLEASAAGFLNFSSNINVSGTSKEQVTMTPNQ